MEKVREQVLDHCTKAVQLAFDGTQEAAVAGSLMSTRRNGYVEAFDALDAADRAFEEALTQVRAAKARMLDGPGAAALHVGGRIQ